MKKKKKGFLRASGLFKKKEPFPKRKRKRKRKRKGKGRKQVQRGKARVFSYPKEVYTVQRRSTMAGWSYQDVSLEDLLRVIKGFLDMLVLASGYQSSGRLAHWDSLNVKKAFHWALFLENVFRSLRCSDDYQGDLAEVDAAISEITCSPCFPKGLSYISSETLSQARITMLKHLVQTLPLRDSHLRAIVSAITEMKSEGLQTMHAPKGTIHSRSSDNSVDGGLIESAIKELSERQAAVSCISVSEAGLAILSKIIRKTDYSELDVTVGGEKLQLDNVMVEERPMELVLWEHWRSRSLSYILDNRTVRLMSGANLLFSSPKSQWVDVIERLSTSADSNDLCEIAELLLLGSIANKWSSVVKIWMSSSYEPITISKMYQEVHNLPLGRFPNLFSKEDANPEGNDVLDYLEVFFRNRFHMLWKLLPVTAAGTIPPRSQLFAMYITELERHIKGSSTYGCCTCTIDGKLHRDCEVAERIWCLYVFHVHNSY